MEIELLEKAIQRERKARKRERIARKEAEFIVESLIAKKNIELNNSIQQLQEIDRLRTESESIAKELLNIKVELEQQIGCLNVAAIVSETDAKGNITFVNDKFCKISEYTREELIGQNHRILKSGKQPPSFFVAMWETISSGSVWKGEVMNKKKGGKDFYWVDTTIMPFKDLNGKIIKYVSIRFDITAELEQKNAILKQAKELKVSEAELRESNLDLEAKTEKLNKEIEKGKELNDLKSRFVSTASHEFRTPLSAINFAAGSIKKYWAKMEPIMIEKKLSKIEDQVLHMTVLLDDMLVVGQAEVGKTRNKPLNRNLGDFIDNIIEEVSGSYKKSHEILLIDTEDLKSGDIFIDEKRGRNIFINLLSNAMKFSPDANKVTVELSSEKDNIIISITDFGIGISKSELKNIFEPFTRGKDVDLISGTGLGLSIVKDSINAIGGKITVNSTIGKGSSFIVKIPKI